MSGQKAALKAIANAIKAQKYDDAAQEAQKLLANDPKSYQAYVNPGICNVTAYAFSSQPYIS